MTQRIDRRWFLQASAGAGLSYWLAAPALSADKVRNANEKLRFACVGVEGKGSSDVDQAAQFGEIVALCDIDENRLGNKAKRYPSAKKYFDFRKMLEEMEKQIDGITVSTPDHTHTLPSVLAMRMKKHVYCQKPLTHTVFEARLMRELAKKYGVATQMGNQGTAENGLRRAVEIVQAGILGPVREVHVWTNRPIWPQAPKVTKRPEPQEAPKNVHWDLFVGPSPERPYAPGYHPFAWRGWWDFGTGALGDMACHTANMAFMALKLAYPETIIAEAGDVNPETYPSWAHVTWTFPARGDMPPVTFHWYEGRRDGKKVLPPEALLKKVLKDGEKLSDSGSMLVGDKGILFSPNDYGAQFRLTPEEQFRGVNTTKPEKLPINGGGDTGMKREWVEMIKGGPAAFSNFDYSGMLTETVLLGNVAIRLTGKKLEWDGPNLKVKNVPEAAALIKTEYRRGWDLLPTA